MVYRYFGTGFDLGMFYDPVLKQVIFSQSQLELDEGEGIDITVKTSRIIKSIMNNVKTHIQATTETIYDFESKTLPTLDFQLWIECEDEIKQSVMSTTIKNSQIK